MGESGVVPGFYPVRTHATVWRNGVITDLGTLGGRSSGIDWAQTNDTGVSDETTNQVRAYQLF